MDDSPPLASASARDTNDKRTRFPSLRSWEDPWEGGLDLRRLRAKKPSIEGVAELLEQSGRTYDAPSAKRPQIEAFVSALKLGSDVGTRLVEDTLLIMGWYRSPEWRESLQLDHPRALKALIAAGRDARSLQERLELDAILIEDVIQSLPGDGADVFDTLDLLELSRQLTMLVSAANIAAPLFGMAGSGRKPDRRRNVAIALATQAAEEATDIRVEIARRGDSWRFANAPGRYVREVLALLDWPDERVLVSAFDKLRREKRVKQ